MAKHLLCLLQTSVAGHSTHVACLDPRLQEYAAVLTAVASFDASPLAIDELWLAEFLLMIQVGSA